MAEPFRHMDTAPRNGMKIILQLKDGFGTYTFNTPCKFINGVWVSHTNNVLIVNMPIGWRYLNGG